jgi:chromosome condensin MukBEF ATPase and DNA-binding subunit MukB
MDSEKTTPSDVESGNLLSEEAAPGTKPEAEVTAETPTTVEAVEPSTEPETFTKEQWEAKEAELTKRYSGLDTKLTTVTRESQTRIQELQEEVNRAYEQAEEARSEALIRTLTEQGADETVAQRVARAERELANKERTLKIQAEAQTKLQEVLNEAGKAKQAHDLIKEHGLEESALEGLIDSKTPDEMVNKALRLSLEKSKSAQIAPTEVAPKTPSTKGRDLSKVPPSIALGTLMSEEESK